jgi:hypothetical protein
MFKRIGALAMILAGGMAVLTPAVAQARDRDDHGRYERHVDRRDWREHDRREWREHDRFDRRYYRPVYYDRFGRPCR